MLCNLVVLRVRWGKVGVVQQAIHRFDTMKAAEAVVVVEQAFVLAPAFLDAYHSKQQVMFPSPGFVIASARRYDSLMQLQATFVV